MTKLLNRVIIINKRRTSMRLCQEEWGALDNICKHEKINRNKIFEVLESLPDYGLGLTYLTRLFMLMYYQDVADEVLCKQGNCFPRRAIKIFEKIENLPHTKESNKSKKLPKSKVPNSTMTISPNV